LYLGANDLLKEKSSRQQLGKLLESRIMQAPPLADDMISPNAELATLADEYYEKYLLKIAGPNAQVPKTPPIEYDLVDTSSMTVFDSREIGTESMCYNMLDRIGLAGYLTKLGWSREQIDVALVSIIARAAACSSEHKTEQWLRQNSALLEFFENLPGKVSRHHLYKASDDLSEIKSGLEGFFYNRLTSMFDIKDKLVIYDLTNTYFEGRMESSDIAKFGRSKEKRYDCRQAVLAAVVNEHGFLKYSKVYEGNMADPVTLSDMIAQLRDSGSCTPEQVVVIDAGIATEENLSMLREKKLKYVCVSRSKLRDFKSTDITDPKTIKDNNGSEIKLKIIPSHSVPDVWMHVESSGKIKKEESMHEKAVERFELEMESAKKGVSKKGGTKKIEKVWERIGRIKERNKRVHLYYEIDVKSEDGTAKDIIWKKKDDPKARRPRGEYFIRTNCSLSGENAIWDIYNTIREVESAFRCLKTDLNLRPVYHQKDKHIEAHLNLGLLAYQIVAPIRYMLKQKGINHGWKNIIRIMNTQKAVSVKQKTKDGSDIIIRTCSRPISEALEIYRALGMSSMPFGTKKYVVHH
jgi:transposase